MPQTTFGIQVLELSHAVVHGLHLLAINLTGEKMLWVQLGGSVMMRAKCCAVSNVDVSMMM